jgi:lipopolysaccharide transport protein LptA
MIYRVMAMLAVLLALAGPIIAQGGHPGSRVFVTYQAQSATERSKAVPDNVLGAFKVDPDTPIHIEADKLVDALDGSQAVFTGNVMLRRGEFLLRTVAMTAFYSGQTGAGDAVGGPPVQLTLVEVREQVLVKSKNGTTATGDWATFDVKANTVLMGDRVVVSRNKDVAQGPRLRIDLTTGIYRFEIDSDSGPAPLHPPGAQIRIQ